MFNTSDTAQHSGQRIKKIKINTDIDAAQHVRHSSTLRTEHKEDNDQHRHWNSPHPKSGTVILGIQLKELDIDQHRLRTKLNTSNTGQYSTKDTAYRDMTNTDRT